MDQGHIVLLRGLSTRTSRHHLLYYYQGNFFYPVTGLIDSDRKRVKQAIRLFTRENKALIAEDRKAPWYKTKLELFDEQLLRHGCEKTRAAIR